MRLKQPYQLKNKPVTDIRSIIYFRLKKTGSQPKYLEAIITSTNKPIITEKGTANVIIQIVTISNKTKKKH